MQAYINHPQMEHNGDGVNQITRREGVFFLMAKPDDRSDNVEKLQEMIQNTEESILESRNYLKANAGEVSSEEQAAIEAKNQRREESIEGFRSEVKDEASQIES